MSYQDESDTSAYICGVCRDTCTCKTCHGRGYTYVTFVRVTCAACKGTMLCPVCCDVNAAARALKDEAKYANLH